MASTIEQIKQLQSQGLTEEQIIKNLRDKNIPYKDILEALSQTKIKAAVEEPPQEQPTNSPAAREISDQPPVANSQSQVSGNFSSTVPQPVQQSPGLGQIPEGMQQSIMTQPLATPELAAPTPNATPAEYTPSTEEYAPAEYNYEQYPEYDSYPAGNLSSDLVSEIAEQIVSEKLGEIRNGVEKIIDFKTTTEAKIENIDERLKRLERTIDTLYTSILRKIGSHIANTEDIKKEMIQTQKTFSKLLPAEKLPRKKGTTKKKSRKK